MLRIQAPGASLSCCTNAHPYGALRGSLLFSPDLSGIPETRTAAADAGVKNGVSARRRCRAHQSAKENRNPGPGAGRGLRGHPASQPEPPLSPAERCLGVPSLYFLAPLLL